MTRIGTLLLVAAACGGSPKPRVDEAGLNPRFDAARQVLGSWGYADGSGVEHWRSIEGAIYGVAFVGDHFEVMVIDDDGPETGLSDGTLRFLAMPDGADPVVFVADPQTVAFSITFRNPAHDFPIAITYATKDDGHDGEGILRATLEGLDGPAPTIEMPYLEGVGPPDAARAAHDADRARGTDREPVYMFASPDGARAATLGRYRNFATTYATIWERDAAGAWQVRFEVTRLSSGAR